MKSGKLRKRGRNGGGRRTEDLLSRLGLLHLICSQLKLDSQDASRWNHPRIRKRLWFSSKLNIPLDVQTLMPNTQFSVPLGPTRFKVETKEKNPVAMAVNPTRFFRSDRRRRVSPLISNDV
ncbi:hypothetical protein U1Q18_039490 [Sarracenia purpurea var. burkii]